MIGQSKENEGSILSCHLHSGGKHAEKLWIEKPGTAGGKWITEEDIQGGKHFPKMDGRYVFKHAVTRLTEVINEALEANKMSIDNIDHFLFHQANIRINEHVAGVLNIDKSKIFSNIHKYGNCSNVGYASTIDVS